MPPSAAPFQQPLPSQQRSRKSNLCSPSAVFPLQNQNAILTPRNRYPESIHQNKVEPKVERLRPGISNSHGNVIKQTRRKIQRIAVKLAHRHHHLHGIPIRIPGHNHRRDNQTPGSPTHRRHRLHAQHEAILRQVPAIGKRILLPHLPDQRLLCPQRRVVGGVVAFEEEVDGAGQDEPHGGRELAGREVRVEASGDKVGRGEEGEAGAEEDAEERRYRPFVRGVAIDVGVEGVVGVGEEVLGHFRHVGGEVFHDWLGHGSRGGRSLRLRWGKTSGGCLLGSEVVGKR